MTNFEIVYKTPNRRRLTSCGLANEEGVDENELEDETDAQDGIDAGEDDEDDDNESTSSSGPVEDSSRPYRMAALVSRRHGIFLQVRFPSL